MTSKAAAEPLDPVAIKAQHTIFYQANTSDIKDDIVQLLGVVKTGTGPLTRSEALFLLSYHAFSGEDRATELINNGAVNTCFGIIDAAEAAAPDKTICAGILLALCTSGGEEACEAVVKGRSGGNTAPVVLHALLRDARDKMRVYAARVLRLVAEQPASRSALLKAMEQKLGGNCALYCGVLSTNALSEYVTVAQVAGAVTALIVGRDDLRDEAIQGNMVEAILTGLRLHKADSPVRGLLALLEALLGDKGAWGRLVARGGIPLLVDLLGPPPGPVTEWEGARYRHVIDPAWAEEQDRKRLEWLRLEEERVRAAAAANGASAGNQSSRVHRSPSRLAKPSRSLKQAESSKTDVGRDEGGEAAAQVLNVSPPRGAQRPTSTAGAKEAPKEGAEEEGAGAAPLLPVLGALDQMLPAPARQRSDLLSVNSAGLKWGALAGVQTRVYAAGCLYLLAQDAEHMAAAGKRLAASRLVPLLQQVLELGEGGKKKGGKKKGLTLTPEQTQLLVRVTGALKFLSLVNVNRYRIAKLGATPSLIAIYENVSHTLLRRNAQVVLSNIAMLAENGQLLLDAKLPEEFLVALPLRLNAEETEELLLEFPDAPLGAKAAAAAAKPPGATPAGQAMPAAPAPPAPAAS
mmetsp:Transcript_37614/g.94986  ORF Transcript_37614/g.94986 Transcript_37614/m.94986 type:complete len:633 (-) Transcript_37614:222-2120(-)